MKLPHAWPRLWPYLKTALREGRVDDAAAGLSATAPADDPGQAPQQQARPPAALPPEVWRFQPDSVLLERAKPPLGARWSLYLLALFVLLLLLWSIFGKMDRIVMADGKIVTIDTPVVLQSYSIALVKDIRVVMGQRVRKGEVLVVLDATFAQADMSQLRDRISSLAAHAQRLECEIGDKPYPPAGAIPPEAGSAAAREQALQSSIYASRQSEYAARLKTYEEQLKRLHTEQAATAGDLLHRKERLKIFTEFEHMRRQLYERGIEARAGFLEAQKDRLSVAGDVLRMESSLQELQHEIASVEADRATYLTNWRSTAAQELVSVRRQLDESREQLNKATKMGELVDIRAPMDAVVLEVARRNAGSVADEAEALVTLVPLDAPLEVDVEIRPGDIGYVRTGQTARIKLATLPFQKHGTLDATVLAVSEDAFLKQTAAGEQSFYRARLKLPAEPLATLRNLPKGFAIMPGMTVMAEINIGDRRIIEYFLYPVLAGFDQSLREPR